MELTKHIGMFANGELGLHASTGSQTVVIHHAYEEPYSEIIQLQPCLSEYFVYIDSVVVGTGGQLEWPLAFDSMLESAAPTGACTVFQPTKTIGERRSDVRTVVDDVATVKAAFGLSISQVADVLRVKRPTIYTWLDSIHAPESLRKANRERLNALSELALAWNRGSPIPPGKYLTASTGGDTSLLEMLKSARLNQDAILEMFQTIHAAMREVENTQTFGERLRSLGFADRPSLTRRRNTSAS